MLTDEDVLRLFSNNDWKDSTWIIALRVAHRAEITAIEKAISLNIVRKLCAHGMTCSEE